MGVYLQELLHSSPDAFVFPVNSQDLLCHLISPMSRLVKTPQPPPSQPPGEHLPDDPFDRALLLVRAIHRVLTFWPIHYPLWASVGIPALCSLMDWCLAKQDHSVEKDGVSRRMTLLGATCTAVLHVVDPLAPRDASVEFGRMHLRSPGTIASSHASLSPTTRPPTGPPSPGGVDDLSQSGGSGLGTSMSSSSKVPTPVHAQTLQCMDRFINQGGLSLIFEVLSIALKECLARHHKNEEDTKKRANESEGDEDAPPDSPPVSMADGTFRLQGQASIHRIISSGLFLALLLFKFGTPRRDISEERFRGREFLRTILLDMFLAHRDKTHLNNVVVGLTVVEALLVESALRRAFVDLGGLIIVPKLICDLGGIPGRRTSSVVDVRHIAYGLLEGDYCPSCFYNNTERESCCRMMVQCMALKATEVMWTSTSRFRSHDSLEMAAVTKEARAVLRQLLTPGLMAIVIVERNANRFLSTLFTSESVTRPSLFWSPQLLAIIKHVLEVEAGKIIHTGMERSRWPLWSSREFMLPDTYRSQYPSLQEELVVDDIFLGPVLKGDLDLGPGKQVAHFLEALEVSITSSHSVLQHLSGRPARTPEEAEAIARQEQALFDKQAVLDAVVRKHPEQVRQHIISLPIYLSHSLLGVSLVP